ncbi:hypothetical protein P4O66_001580, partial [Electrophorus voltai]
MTNRDRVSVQQGGDKMQLKDASLLSCSCQCSKVQVPKSVTAIKGTCVVVPCSTTSHTYATWYKYQRSGYPPVYSKDTKDIINQFRGRTSLLGNAMQGNCSLKIDNVRQEDGGISLYVWINPHNIYGDYTEIKVLAPSETHISVESTQVEGTLFSAKCTVRHSCPVSPPLLEWLGLSSVSNEVTTTQDSGGLWVSVAHAQFNASRRDHVPPTILPDSACWEREGSLHCMCWVEAEPNASISWTVDGRSALLPHFNMTNNYTGMTTVSVMTGPPGHFVTCEAANYLGNDTYQMSGFPQLAQGTVGFYYFILAAIVFIFLGIVIVVHRRLKKRLQCAVMDRVIKLFLTASLLSCSCRCSKVQVPKSVTAIKGTCVVVPCSTTSHTYATWYKYQRSGYPPVYSKDTKDIINQFRGRTSLLGNAMQGNCSLKIDNVRQEDGGISLYVWINPHNIYGDYTEIKVLAPSETCISVESTQVEGTLFSAKCTVRHSCPVSPPLLEWLGLSSVSNEVTTTQDSGGLWVSVAHAQFNASRRDHECFSVNKQNPPAIVSTENLIRSFITYAGKLLFVALNGETRMKKRQNIESNGTQTKVRQKTYEWHKDDNVYANDVSGGHIWSTAMVTSQAPEDEMVKINRPRFYLSVLRDDERPMGDSFTPELLMSMLEVAPSETRISVESIQVEGTLFSANCTVRHSCPVSPPLLEWLGLSSVSNEVSTTQDSGGLWVSVAHAQFNASRRDHSKRVTCRRKSDGNTATGEPLNILFPPTILPDSACWEREESLHCMCWVEAEPNASISWTVDGRSALLPHFNMTNNYMGRTTVSVMTGPLGHFVTCEAANYLGNDTYQMSGFPQLAQGNLLDVSKKPCLISSGTQTKAQEMTSIDDIYANDVLGGHTWRTTMVTSQTPE